MYYPELEQLASENEAWAPWLSTLDEVVFANLGKVVTLEFLLDFLDASASQLETAIDELVATGNAKRTSVTTCAAHTNSIIAPIGGDYYCDLCDRSLRDTELAKIPAIDVELKVFSKPEPLKTGSEPLVPTQYAQKLQLSHEQSSPNIRENERERKTRASSPKHAILLVHGIRDMATPWYSRVKRVFRDQPQIEIVGVKYGFFNAINFLAPLDLTKPPYKALLKAYEDVKTTHPSAKISIVAHSFGTFLVGELLRKHQDLELYRVLFCGSVLVESFDWLGVRDYITGEPAVMNECGTEDPWPVMAKYLNRRYGAAGRNGFANDFVAKSSFFEGGHSLFLEESHIRAVWRPFLLNGARSAGNSDGPKPMLIERILSIPFSAFGFSILSSAIWMLLYLFVPLLTVALAIACYRWIHLLGQTAF